VTGRQTSSADNIVGMSAPLVLVKSGAQTVAALPGRFYNDHGVPMVVKRVHASVGTAPTGAGLTVDVKINGTTVFTAAGDRATVAATTFAGSAVPTKSGDAITLLPGQYLTAEVAQVGSTIAGSDLVVQITLGV